MNHFDPTTFLGLLVVMLGAAKLGAILAQWLGQPTVLGELTAGVVVGTSVLGLVDPRQETLRLLAELGVIILLFEIGLETDLGKLLRAGPASTAVAIAGVALPFGLGYATCRLLGLDNLVAILAGATLTATSVGITARVLTDLGRLQEPESQIVLGAAVIDDVIGLIILTVVAGVVNGQEPTVEGVARITGLAFGFLIGAVVLGRWLVLPLMWAVRRVRLTGSITAALLLAFGLAWSAAQLGSAPIIGAFAAGLLLRRSGHVHTVEREIAGLGHFLVPLFFGARSRAETLYF